MKDNYIPTSKDLKERVNKSKIFFLDYKEDRVKKIRLKQAQESKKTLELGTDNNIKNK